MFSGFSLNYSVSVCPSVRRRRKDRLTGIWSESSDILGDRDQMSYSSPHTMTSFSSATRDRLPLLLHISQKWNELWVQHMATSMWTAAGTASPLFSSRCWAAAEICLEHQWTPTQPKYPNVDFILGLHLTELLLLLIFPHLQHLTFNKLSDWMILAAMLSGTCSCVLSHSGSGLSLWLLTWWNLRVSENRRAGWEERTLRHYVVSYWSETGPLCSLSTSLWVPVIWLHAVITVWLHLSQEAEMWSCYTVMSEHNVFVFDSFILRQKHWRN